MADEADSGQKTEEPSSRKLAEARNRGQVAQSREVNTWFMLMAGTGIVLFLAPSMSRVLGGALISFMRIEPYLNENGVIWPMVGTALGKVAVAMLLPMLVAVLAAAGGTLVQIGLVFATEKIGFDVSHISPLGGIKRMFSVRSLVEFGKSLAKIGAVATVAIWMVMPSFGTILDMAREPAEAVPGELYHLTLKLLYGVLAVVTALAIIDYGYQRFAFMKSMRMSKQEQKEEHKQSEGDPKIRSRLRQIRMERSRRRMMTAVPKASVIITNPTHFAVALQYELGDSGAPRVVAKGADLIAFKIREIATANDIPIVENPPLARALYAGADIDKEIPAEHYKAVAEIISYVFRLKGKLKAQPAPN